MIEMHMVLQRVAQSGGCAPTRRRGYAARQQPWVLAVPSAPLSPDGCGDLLPAVEELDLGGSHGCGGYAFGGCSRAPERCERADQTGSAAVGREDIP